MQQCALLVAIFFSILLIPTQNILCLENWKMVSYKVVMIIQVYLHTWTHTNLPTSLPPSLHPYLPTYLPTYHTYIHTYRCWKNAYIHTYLHLLDKCLHTKWNVPYSERRRCVRKPPRVAWFPHVQRAVLRYDDIGRYTYGTKPNTKHALSWHRNRVLSNCSNRGRSTVIFYGLWKYMEVF